jgi:hypothetical protein
MAYKFYLAEACQRYRETFIQFLRGKNAFASRLWFTDDPIDQEPLIANPAQATEQMLSPDSAFMRERMAWAHSQQKRRASHSEGQLDLTDMPLFSESGQRTLTQSLAIMVPGLAVLLLSLGLSVLVTITRFLRYDPR